MNRVLSERDLTSVIAAIGETGESLDRALCALTLATEEEIAEAYASALGHDCLNRREVDLDRDLARQVEFSFLKRHRVFPLCRQGNEILVAVVDAIDLTGLKGCAFALEAPARPLIATATEVEELIASADCPEPAEPSTEALFDADAARLKDLASAEPAVRLCNKLVTEAAKMRASDIHIEPEERGFRVRFRIDGALIERGAVSYSRGLAAISRLKILSNLDIAERRRPQDGRFSFPAAGRSIDLRVSSTPTVHGEGVALRLLQRADLKLDLPSLGFSLAQATVLHRLSDRPNGILLLTGPTGSGKTTTLYALLNRLAARELKILTIEDPVEYQISGVSQTQVNPAIGLTFAAALRSFLRHDPDIIMVGEMRDLETARTAVQAALTGHLVLSTLHTNDAPSAVVRLIDMGVEDYLVASSLIGVVGQRLVRQICKACGGKTGPRDLEAPVCPDCFGAGYRGRIAVGEVLEIDDALRVAIKKSATAADLRRAAREAGYVSMREDGDAKIASGLTTEQEVLKAIVA